MQFTREKADPGDGNQVPVPFAGVLTPLVAEGNGVVAGQPLARLEAMKLEATIPAPHDGRVVRLVVAEPGVVDGGDLFLVLG